VSEARSCGVLILTLIELVSGRLGQFERLLGLDGACLVCGALIQFNSVQLILVWLA